MSTEFKHTPGPWEVYYPKVKGGLGIDTADGKESIVVFDDEAGIYGESWEKDEANARLIAAAPEMLEALQALLNDAEKLWSYAAIPSEDKSGWSFKKAQAAIKKATGQ